MQTVFTLLSIIILSNARLALNDGRLSLINARSGLNNSNDKPENLLKTVNQSLPKDYTRNGTFNLQFKPRCITYSPDENWIVYISNEDNFPNRVYFRNRTSYTEESSVRIGESQNVVSIRSLAFSKSGDLLFVGTETQNLFVCKFNSNMKEQDCLKSYYLGNSTSVNQMAINSANKIVAVGQGNMWVMNFTSDGDFAMQIHMEFEHVQQLLPLWHPKAETDTLLIGARNDTFSDGFISVLNVTTQQMNTLNTTPLFHINVLKDGQTLLVTEKAELVQYNLTLTSVSRIGTITTIVQYIQQISQDGKILVSLQLQSKARIVIYSLEQSTNSQSSNFPHSLLIKNTTINLKQLFSIDCNSTSWYAISSDANDILVSDTQYSEIDRYTLCLNNTYFNNMQCLNCSTECKTCHVTANLCFQCLDNTYALKDASCLKCKSFIPGCLTCSNSSYCLNCDTVAGFVKTPSNGICQCSDFNYVKQGYCVTCDGKSICRKCTSTTFCLTCNKLNNWQETPVNGTCLCQDFYFNSSSTCTLCDSLRVCRSCDNSSFCTKCDTMKGFSQTPVNGVCVCPTSFTLNSAKCISCLVEGCATCLQENVCYQCDSCSSLSDGKCIKQSKSMIFIFVGIGVGVILVGVLVYCKCKNVKKKKLEESLITSGKGEGAQTKGETIISVKKSNENGNLSVGNFFMKFFQGKIEVEPKFSQQIIGSKNSKVNEEKRDILIEQKYEEQDDDYKNSFIGKYKKLMRKSDVQNKSNIKSRLRQEEQKIEQKAPLKVQKGKKMIKEKDQSEFNRQVKKIESKSKDYSHLSKHEYDESKQTQEPQIKPKRVNVKKRPEDKVKYQQIPESAFEEVQFKEERPKQKQVKNKNKLKQEKPIIKEEKSKYKKHQQKNLEETMEQKPQFNELKGKAGVNNKINLDRSKVNKEDKKETAAGLNDNEQAAYNELTDEQKIMLRLVRGSFGES